MNIPVLRSVFDKLGGLSIACHFVTPKRPLPLPEILSSNEVRRVLAAAPSTRNQLLLGLLYGCGLKVSEACRLKWADVDAGQDAFLDFQWVDSERPTTNDVVTQYP